MLSAPVGIVALGLLFVRLRSNEPTQSLFARWPDQPQISKCEVRPATPLEISRGADFGLTMQMVSPYKTAPTYGLRYSITEIALKSRPSKSLVPGAWYETHCENRKAAHPIQQDYVLWEETEAFNRRALKSADGIIEVDLKGGRRVQVPPMTDKVVQLDTKQIPPPDVNTARKPNFLITKATLYEDTRAQLDVEGVTDESQGLLSKPQTVGKWTMEGHPNQPIEASIGSWEGKSKDITSVDVFIRFSKNSQPPLEGAKFRGLISLNRGWPQEVTLEWPKTLDWRSKRQDVKFTAKLAPLPK